MAMKEIQSALQSHAQSVAGKSVEWGVDDCTSWVRAWIEARTGKEIHAPDYSSQGQAEALIAEYNGLDKLWSHCLEGAGFWGLDDPALSEYPPLNYGDPVLFDTKRFGLCGGILTTCGIVAWRSTKSIHFIQPRLAVKGWRIS